MAATDDRLPGEEGELWREAEPEWPGAVFVAHWAGYVRAQLAPAPFGVAPAAPQKATLPDPAETPVIAPLPLSAELPSTAAPPTSPAAVPSDPLFGDQWHLLNTGQTGGTPGIDINVVGVWDDYSGAGVTIGVIDDGFEYTHPDLAANYNTAIDFDTLQGDADPLPGPGDNHGTTTTGIIVAEADNGIGVVGVAPGAEAAGFRIGFGAAGNIQQIVDAFELQAGVDVSNNSWGYSGLFYDDFDSALFQGAASALENAVAGGRGGLGTVFVFAAGNERADGQNVNYHSFQNSPYTIAVAAIDDDGEHASFSTPGAALLVSAPGVDVVTTDRTGSDGYVSGDYVIASGTSYAAPIVAGVVALMLEANPDLGYRDVQEILAYSAGQTDPGSLGWALNGADNWNGGGLHVSHDYGFGLVDAHDAVRLAETWTAQHTFQNQVRVTATSAPEVAIPDQGSVSDSLVVSESLEIDQVGVVLDLDHTWIGDLTVTLTSPDGTESVLVERPGKNPDSPVGFGSNQDDIQFTLYSTHHWGESGAGEWTLTVTDSAAQDTGVLHGWTLVLIGDAPSDDDVYVFTDEFSAFVAPGYVLGDVAGVDAVNAAAVTSESIINLTPGAPSRIDDTVFSIAGGSVIENAYGGDGDDILVGNDADNLLDGGRGDDVLLGRAAADALWGGDGADILVGGEGPDVLAGGDGADTLVGGEGPDVLAGGAGRDILVGGEGPDVLAGGAGRDILIGGEGPDVLAGGAGRDILIGNAGPSAPMDGASDVFDFDVLELGSFDIILGFDTSAPSTGGDILDLSDMFADLAEQIPGLESARVIVTTDVSPGNAVVVLAYIASGTKSFAPISVLVGVGDSSLLDDNLVI